MLLDILLGNNLSIILVVVIIILIIENNKLQQKVVDLNKKLRGVSNIQTNAQNISQSGYTTPTNTVTPTASVSQTPRPTYTTSAPRKVSATNSAESKNNAILITGAIFIILSAIVFLGSTWSVLNPTIKTLVMFLLIGVFLGASHIAKKKFNLEKTSNTFFYIAMAYIPICFGSLWMLGIISDLWQGSIVNEFAYFSFTSVITACIYYLYYTKRKSKVLYVGSVLFGLLSLVCFVLIFSNSTGIICLTICLYSLLFTCLMLALHKQDNEFNKGIAICLYGFGMFFTGALTLNALFLTPVVELLSQVQFDFSMNLNILISLIVMGINGCILYFKYEKDVIFWILQSCTFYAASIFIAFRLLNGVDNNIIIFAGVALALAISAIYVLLTKGLQLSKYECIVNRVLINCCLPMYYFIALTMVLSHNVNTFVPPMVALLELIVLFICYFKTDLKTTYKYLIYLCSIILIYSFVNCFEFAYKDQVFSLIPLGFTLVVYMLESINKKLRDAGSDALLIVLNFISFIAIFPSDSVTVTVIGLVFAIILFIMNVINKENEYLRIIPMAGALILLLGTQGYSDRFYLAWRLAMAVLLTAYPLLSKKKLTAESIFGGIFTVMLASFFESHTIRLLIYLAWEFVNFVFVSGSKNKDAMKALMYATVFALYVDLLNKTALKDYSSTFKIPFVIMVVLYLKTIIKKYVKSSSDRDLLDYLLLGITYFIALASYSNVYDGMIFSFFLVLLMIYSYIRKHGAIFVVTTIAVIVNAFLLTREFWLSIPWWGYLLFIGIVLIAFAIRNESKENKEKISIGSKIKEFKENIDSTDSKEE